MINDTTNTTDTRGTATASPSEVLKNKAKRVTLEMAPDRHKRLRKACLHEDRTMRDFITQAVDELLDRKGL